MSQFKVPQNKNTLPSRGISSSYQIWLQQKKTNDSNLWGFDSKYWMVKGYYLPILGKLYDFTDFIHKHPGGSHWLQYTRGQNITEHYIVHHLKTQKIDKILQKYQIQNIKPKNEKNLSDRYTFQQNGLYNEVKKRMLNLYSKKQLQDSSKSKRIGVIVFCLWMISLIMTGIYQSYYWAVLCGYLIIPAVGIAHNFVHMRPNYFKYFYNLTGFTPKQWEIMHCLSHHQYSNTLLDYQLQAFEPIIYFIRILPQNKLIKIILVQIIYIVTVPLNIILKLIVVPLIKLCSPQWGYLLTLFQIVILYSLNGNIIQSVKLWLTIHCFFAFLFIKITFGGHRIQNLWTQGCQQIKDYGQHTVYTCNDIYPQLKGGFLSFFIVAGFNVHSVHHMFPTIDNAHLYKVNQILKQVCKERNIKQSQVGLFKSIASVYKNYFNRVEWNKNQNVK